MKVLSKYYAHLYITLYYSTLAPFQRNGKFKIKKGTRALRDY